MELKEMTKNIKNLMDKDYENFVKAIISIEKNINDLELLDDIYEEYIDNDYIQLLNNDFDEIIEEKEQNDKSFIIEEYDDFER